MITLKPVHSHINYENLGNHARWRNESLLWTRECKETNVSDQFRFFYNLKEDQQFFFIFEDSKLVGTTGLTSINLTHKTAEFSLLIGSEYQRKGYGSQALTKLLEYGFSTLKLHLIYGETFRYPNGIGTNPGAKAYDKLGFTLDGTLRQRYFKEGVWVDTLVYSITDYEFKRTQQ